MGSKITIIIVTYNSDDTIKANLDSLQNGVESGIIKVVVVDNNSDDNTVDIISKNYPWVKLLASEINLGYGKGLNAGLSYANTPYILFMNPDAIMTTDNILIMSEVMDCNPNIGITAPSIKRRNGAYQEAGMLITPVTIIKQAFGIKRFMVSRKEICKGDHPFKTNWLCGAIMLCRTNLIKEMRGFDPVFFLYFEETDLCKRVMMKGFELWAIGKAEAKHMSNASARKVDPSLSTGGVLKKHYYESRNYYLKKHYGWFAFISASILEITLFGIRDIARYLTRKKARHQFKERMDYAVFSFPKS